MASVPVVRPLHFEKIKVDATLSSTDKPVKFQNSTVILQYYSFFLPETGFLCVALADLELTL